MKFDVAPLDSYAVRITSGIAYLGGLLMLPLLFAYLSNMRWGGLLTPVALAIPLATFLLIAYALQPVEYAIDGAQLIVRRRWFRAFRIPLRQISAVSLAPGLADVPRRGLRFAFNPGVFGYQGPFRLDPYGETFFMATNRARLVAVARTQATPLIISPIHPRDFINELNEQRSQVAVKEMAE